MTETTPEQPEQQPRTEPEEGSEQARGYFGSDPAEGANEVNNPAYQTTTPPAQPQQSDAGTTGEAEQPQQPEQG